MRDVSKRVDEQLPKWFGLLPRCPYGVVAIPAEEAPTAADGYYNPPPPGQPLCGLIAAGGLGRVPWFCSAK